MRTLASLRQKTSQANIVITSVALTSPDREMSSLLHDIANQNFSNFTKSSIASQPGRYIQLNSSSASIGEALGDFYLASPTSHSQTAKIHPPHRDTVGGGVTVSLTQVATVMERTIGVVGVDIHLADITEDITHWPPSEGSYVFLLDRSSGATIAHPAVGPPEKQKAPSTPHIAMLEIVPGFDDALHRITSFPTGNYTVSGNVTYTWVQVPSTPYIVVVASRADMPAVSYRLGPVQLPDTGSVQYHRLLDLAGDTDDQCRHFREVASMKVTNIGN